MNQYTEIKSAKELDEFLHETVSFHDSILKELQMINRGYVMENKSMNTAHKFDIRILFQTQWEPVAFEILCLSSKYISAIGPEEYMGSSGKYLEKPNKLIELSLDNGEFIIQCENLYYKLCPEKHGNYEHLGSQVPSETMSEATHINSNWWQCGNCSEAWQVDIGRSYSTCPKCNSVAILHST